MKKLLAKLKIDKLNKVFTVTKAAGRFVIHLPGKIAAMHRARKLKRHANLARKYLKSMDMTMKALGMNRQQMRQFWRDFTKYPEMRDRFFEAGNMTK